MKAKATIVPVQAAEFHDIPALGFEIFHQSLVAHLVDATRRQDSAPMLHKRLIPSKIAADLGQIIGVVLLVKSFEKQETQVSTGSLIICMIFALGSAKWIRPAN
jgi:hypothetical protein